MDNPTYTPIKTHEYGKTDDGRTYNRTTYHEMTHVGDECWHYAMSSGFRFAGDYVQLGVDQEGGMALFGEHLYNVGYIQVNGKRYPLMLENSDADKFGPYGLPEVLELTLQFGALDPEIVTLEPVAIAQVQEYWQ